MNILAVIPSYAPKFGGAERQLEGLIRAFSSQKNFYFSIITQRLSSTAQLQTGENFQIIRTRIGYRLFFIPFFVIFLNKNRVSVDIIHCHSFSGLSILLSLFLKFKFSAPLLIKVPRTGVGSDLERYLKEPIYNNFFKISKNFVDYFACLSPGARDDLVNLGVSKEKIVIVENGVQCAAPKLKNKTKNSKIHSIKIVTTGRLIYRKRVDILIRITAELLLNYDITLGIIGNGPEEENLKMLVCNLNISEKVHFHGALSHADTLNLLSAADVYVSTSESEGMSNSTLEAMANGVVPIARNIEANQNIITHGSNGFLFDQENDLKVILERLVNNQDNMYQYSNNALSTVRSKYDFDIVCEKYTRLYVDMLEKF